MLYFATPLQTLHKVLEGNRRLVLPRIERLEILGILGKRALDRVVYHLGQRSIRRSSLQSKGAMNLWIKINRGSLVLLHPGTLAS